MCGRYAQTSPALLLENIFSADIDNKYNREDYEPSWNVSPGDNVPAIVEFDKRVLSRFRWGLIPGWVKKTSTLKPPINARAETLSSKPYFKSAFRRRRCLIPADGFYEWETLQVPGSSRPIKLPWYFKSQENRVLSFAGLYEIFKPQGSGIDLFTCTIITCEANSVLSPIHDRMPVIVDRSCWDIWLRPDKELSENETKEILRPAETSLLEKIAVTKMASKHSKPVFELK